MGVGVHISRDSPQLTDVIGDEGALGAAVGSSTTTRRQRHGPTGRSYHACDHRFHFFVGVVFTFFCFPLKKDYYGGPEVL